MAKEVLAANVPSSSCCREWSEKYNKLKDKYTKLEEGRNALRKGLSIFEQQVTKLQSENLSLKNACQDEKLRADNDRDEKERESALRVSLESEVSVLKSTVQSLQENGGSVALDMEMEVSQLRERLSEKDSKVNELKELLEKERMSTDDKQRKAEADRKKAEEAWKMVREERSMAEKERRLLENEKKKIEENKVHLETLRREADESKLKLDSEMLKYKESKKKAEAERKKADEALKKAEAERSRAEEERRLVESERKKLEETRIQAEKLINDSCEAKSKLASEMSKYEEAKKKAEAERLKAEETQKKLKAAKSKDEKERKKIKENTIQLKTLKSEADEAKRKLCLETAKYEEATKSLETEKQNMIREKKRVKLEIEKAEELKKLAETNRKMAMDERSRADDLFRQLELARKKVGELQKEITELVSSGTLTGGLGPETREVTRPVMDQEYANPQEACKRLKDVEQKLIKEKERADAEMEKAEEQRLIAEAYKIKASQEKCNADELLKKLQRNEKRMEELLLERDELNSSGTPSKSPLVSVRDNNNSTMKMNFLKKQLKFEKKQVKHAKEVARLEISRSILQQELLRLKQEFFQFSQRLDILDDSLFQNGANSHDPEKRNPFFGHEVLKPNCTRSRAVDGSYAFRQNLKCIAPSYPVSGVDCTEFRSGTESKLEPFLRGSNGIMLNRSAINSSSASFSDRQLVGSQERGASVTTSSELSGEIPNDDPKTSRLCGDKRKRNDYNTEVGHRNNTRNPISVDVGGRKKKRKGILHAVESIEKLYSDGHKWHKQVSEKLSLLHDMLNNQVDTSFEKRHLLNGLQVKMPRKCFQPEKIMTSVQEVAIPCLKDSSQPTIRSEISDFEECDAVTHVLPSLHDNPITVEICKDGRLGNTDDVVDCDYMKLLDLDNDADEISFRKAMERPLSPTLPVIEYHSRGALEADISVHGGKGSKDLPECTVASSCNIFPRYLVVFSSDNDLNSITRVIQLTRSYMSRLRGMSLADIFVRDILLILSKAEELSAREKVCVFLSLLLHGIFENSKRNLEKVIERDSMQYIKSVAREVCAGLSDLNSEMISVGSCSLYELLALIEDFILYRKVLVYDGVSSESTRMNDSQSNLVLNSSDLHLEVQVAPTEMLVAGSIFLALVCTEVAHISFICEVSCNVLRMLKSHPSLLLTILHVFAYLCGSKYLNLETHALVMITVKSLVMLTENLNPTAHSTYCFLSLVDQSCISCPFSEGAVSTDIVASLLLEKLRNCILSGEVTLECLCRKEKDSESSILEETSPVNLVSDEKFCQLIDILSLVELVADFESWEWSFKRLVSPLLEMLVSSNMEHVSAAVIVLLSKLGRRGIDANGYEDTGVENLRCWLGKLLGQSSFKKLPFSLQIAVASALVDLIPLKLEELFQENCEIRSLNCQSSPVDCIRNWFSCLSKEQQSIVRLL